MDSKELRLFREAYGSVYTPQTENIQEGEYDDAKRAERSATEGQRRAQDEARRRRMRNQPGGFAAGDPEDKVKAESSDLFDIVKGHLMSEGYADTEEAALAIMAHMSEEWKQIIVEYDGSAENRNSPANRDRSYDGLSPRQIRMKQFADKRSQGLLNLKVGLPFRGV